jgi:hypothetical protein
MTQLRAVLGGGGAHRRAVVSGREGAKGAPGESSRHGLQAQGKGLCLPGERTGKSVVGATTHRTELSVRRADLRVTLGTAFQESLSVVATEPFLGTRGHRSPAAWTDTICGVVDCHAFLLWCSCSSYTTDTKLTFVPFFATVSIRHPVSCRAGSNTKRGATHSHRRVGRAQAPGREVAGADAENLDFIVRRFSPEFTGARISTASSALRLS